MQPQSTPDDADIAFLSAKKRSDTIVANYAPHNDRNKSKLSQMYDLFIQFCENTSLRGIPRIVRASDRRKRLLWSNFVLLFFIACVACLILITNQYLQYDVIHQPKTIFEAPRSFPSLTICNLRPFKSSDVDRLNRLGAIPVQSYFDAIMKVASTLDKHFASQFTTLLSLESYLLNLPDGMTPGDLGHRYDQMVRICIVVYQNGTTTRGTNCGKAGQWIKTTDRIYHNCYTYELDPDLRKQTLSVEMVLYLDNIVEQTSCFDCQDRIRGSQLTGARLLLNPDSSYPRIVEEGINLMPGTLTDIRFTVREWLMMTPPYGRCNHEAPSSISFSGQTYSYTEHACQQGVVQEMIAQRCGCLSYDMPTPTHLEAVRGNATDGLTSLDALRFCQYFELPVANISASRAKAFFTKEAMEKFETRMRCSTSLTRNTVAAETGCRAPCRRYSYDTQISSAQWPTKRFVTNFATRQIRTLEHERKMAALHGNDTLPAANTVESRFLDILRPYTEIYQLTKNGSEAEAVRRLMQVENVERNFLSIIVSRSNFDIVRVEEKAVVTLTSLFSQIGGLLSIWVGITMICFVEVAELMLNCFDVVCGHTPM